jgi:tetratricopeptide (TPR) repeat protein
MDRQPIEKVKQESALDNIAGSGLAQSLLSKALRAHEADHLEEAKNLYAQILAIDINNSKSLHGLGLIANRYGNYEIAAKMARRAIDVDGSDASYRFSLATALQGCGQYEEALCEYYRVAILNTEDVLCHFSAGNILQLQGKLDEAIAEYRRVLEIKPGSVDAYYNVGNVFRLQGRMREAREYYMQALRLQSDNSDAIWNLCLLDLLEGDYEAGWQGYEVRHHRGIHGLREFPEPQWQGEPLTGARILLHAEQGLGDTLQFLRYVPMVQAAGGRVILDVPKTLYRLAAESNGHESIIATGESLPSFEWHCPLMSLPLAFKTSLQSLPAQVPYLKVPEQAVEDAVNVQWTDCGLRVGLVWSGNPKYAEDRNRSIPLPSFNSLLQIEGIQFFSLQIGPAASQLAEIVAPLADLGPGIGDMADTAARIARLDLVITVDTAVAHLAGALGVQVWVLLPLVPDWRWLMNREDSPWYPTARLFRQLRFGDWDSVMERIHKELAALAFRTRIQDSQSPSSLSGHRR